MKFTGERMVPGAAGRNELFFEHVVRYAFAARHVPGRRVLDAGCGCGYGSQFLSRSGADEVVGVDVDPAAIDYCRQHFEADDLRFMTADVMALPFDDASFDVVTCFEVFEHVDPPDALLAELRRVLHPEGVLVVSTPNALTYAADTDDGSNPFHVREYTPTELKALIGARFEKVEFFVQNPFGGIGIFPMDHPRDAATEVDLQVLSTPQDSLWGEPQTIQAAAEKSAYLIAECGAASSSSEGQLYAMARDLADTTLERRAVDAYVEELTEQYGLLKSEQAVTGEWVEGVRGELADAMRELERLRREHATLERASEEAAESRLRLEGYVEELESQRQLEREAKERAETLVMDNRAQQAESKAWAKRVEQDLQTLEEEHRRLSEDRAGLAESLETSSKWAKQLETELDHTRSRLDAVQEAYGELEAAEEDRTAWAKDLSGQLEAAHGELATLRAEVEAKTAHAGELDRWARDLAQQLKTEKTARRPEDGEWVEQLEADLRAKTERLEAVEEAHRALSKQHGETSAWARQLEASLEETRAADGDSETGFTDLQARFTDLEKSYAGLDDRYGILEKSYG
ncbi:MAG: methyltransferase domain-containing protein, partial [Planctomycetota bacterium]